MIFVSGCSNSGPSKQLFTTFKSLDPRDSKKCYDPGVNKDSHKALTENRAALVHCSKKHQNVVKTHNELLESLAEVAAINSAKRVGKNDAGL